MASMLFDTTNLLRRVCSGVFFLSHDSVPKHAKVHHVWIRRRIKKANSQETLLKGSETA